MILKEGTGDEAMIAVEQRHAEETHTHKQVQVIFFE